MTAPTSSRLWKKYSHRINLQSLFTTFLIVVTFLAYPLCVIYLKERFAGEGNFLVGRFPPSAATSSAAASSQPRKKKSGQLRDLEWTAPSSGEKRVESGELEQRVRRRVTVPQCGCDLDLPLVPEEDNAVEYSDTTCGRVAHARGRGQKVVGFSFYGHSKSEKHRSKQYLRGIKENLQLMPKFYPGWIMRLYYDVDDGDDVLRDLCALACQDPNLDLCYIRDLPGTPIVDASGVFAMNWRFFPTLDPQVDYFVSRDLDSRFSAREAAAVAEWLSGPAAFHMMRDHPLHNIHILGSGWGVKLLSSEIRSQWRSSWMIAKNLPMMWAPRKMTGPDQGFLRRFIWPWAKRDSLQHDAYSCHYFDDTVGFPTPRRNETNNFVASVVSLDMYIWETCPRECRRKGHEGEWEHC